MPSATNPLGEASVASQPPAPSVAAATSYLDSNLSQGMQRFATQQQDLLNAVQVLNQEIAQVVFYAKMELGHFFGIKLIASNQLSNAASVTQNNSGAANGSGSGSSSGAVTTHHESDQPIHSFAQTAGSGKGSGVSPASSGGSATVYGNVWLDNDGDGIEDDGEQGFSGINVDLYAVGNSSPLMLTTTNGEGDYTFTVPNLPPPSGSKYYIAVGLPNFDQSTNPNPGYSKINVYGDSADFGLYAGAPPVEINAGICSMNVTILEDDPNDDPFPDQVTLRDAIETGNNGDGLHLNSSLAVTFIDPQNGQSLDGAIQLLEPLPDIIGTYDIDGPGSAYLTVEGPGGGTSSSDSTQNPLAASPLVGVSGFRVFSIRGGAHGISGLTIRGGTEVGDNGGGV